MAMNTFQLLIASLKTLEHLLDGADLIHFESKKSQLPSIIFSEKQHHHSQPHAADQIEVKPPTMASPPSKISRIMGVDSIYKPIPHETDSDTIMTDAHSLTPTASEPISRRTSSTSTSSLASQENPPPTSLKPAASTPSNQQPSVGSIALTPPSSTPYPTISAFDFAYIQSPDRRASDSAAVPTRKQPPPLEMLELDREAVRMSADAYSGLADARVPFEQVRALPWSEEDDARRGRPRMRSM